MIELVIGISDKIKAILTFLVMITWKKV